MASGCGCWVFRAKAAEVQGHHPVEAWLAHGPKPAGTGLHRRRAQTGCGWRILPTSEPTRVSSTSRWYWMSIPARWWLGHGGADNPRSGHRALTMAVWRRRPAPGLIAHSDRGSQYASGDYQAALELHGFLCSMSRKAIVTTTPPWKAFHSLKVEQVHDHRYRTRGRARADLFEYIETYYNPIRRHSTLDYLSPRDFENRKAA